MITREEAIQTIHDCRITSLGELAHGYMIYQATANILINQLFDQFESQLSGNPLQLNCNGCKIINECSLLKNLDSTGYILNRSIFSCAFYNGTK